MDLAPRCRIRIHGGQTGSSACDGTRLTPHRQSLIMKDFWPVILITFVGFFALAAMLLIPVWRFLSREEEAGEAFTQAVEDDLSWDAADPEPASNPELASNLEPASNLETASNPDVDQDRVGSAA